MKLPKKKFICALIKIMLTPKWGGRNQGDKNNKSRTKVLCGVNSTCADQRRWQVSAPSISVGLVNVSWFVRVFVSKSESVC